MSNIISASLDALAQGASYAPALVFIAGLATSFGPCSAPRLITIVSCSALSRKAGALVVLVFVSGLTTAYASLGWIFGALGRVGDIASFTYAILATSLGVGGLFALVGAESHGGCDRPQSIGPSPSDRLPLAVVFGLGFGSALVVAPCCAPALVAIVAYTTEVGNPTYGAALLTAFGLGHGLPAALIGLGVGGLSARLRLLALNQATIIAGSVLSIALGFFYACLI